MSDPLTLNQRIVLVSRPVGAPTPENFRLERVDTARVGRRPGAAQDSLPVAGPLHARAYE
jgi:NADPH-dependent curcumin reductase CurA